MTNYRLLAPSALVAIASAICAAPNISISPQRLSAVDREISSDAFEGRGPATRAETKTINYIASKFREAGLQPGGSIAGGKRSWFQNVPLLMSEIADVRELKLDLGNGRTVPLTQGSQIAIRAPLNGQQFIDLQAVPLVFVGYGVTAPERQWDDFKNVDVRGKLIVVLINDPDFEGGEGAPGARP